MKDRAWWRAATALLPLVIVLAPAAAWARGWRVERIESNSMRPLVSRGDAVLVRPVSPHSIDIGDVIVFRNPADRQIRMMHRVVSVLEQNGQAFFQTKGDANEGPDFSFVPSSDVEGRLVLGLPYVGHTIQWLRPPAGAVILVMLALLVQGVSARRRIRRSLQTSAALIDDDAYALLGRC